MKKRLYLFTCVLILSVSVSVMGSDSTENSARSSFAKALIAAKAWQGDAILTHISTPSVNANGTAKEWIHEFYSPKNKNWYYISALGEKIEGTEVGYGRKDGLSDQFIDSIKAMELAKTHGLKGMTPGMSLSAYRFGANPEGYWMVSGGNEKGDVTVFLEAKTGKLFTKNIIE